MIQARKISPIPEIYRNGTKFDICDRVIEIVHGSIFFRILNNLWGKRDDLSLRRLTNSRSIITRHVIINDHATSIRLDTCERDKRKKEREREVEQMTLDPVFQATLWPEINARFTALRGSGKGGGMGGSPHYDFESNLVLMTGSRVLDE